MSDKTYRLRDIPKGQRLKHFFTYYKLRTFLCLAFAVLIGYGLYGIFRPPSDLQVMWLADGYSLECEFELRENLEALDWDTNGDGHVGLMLTHIDFDRDYHELSMDTMSELTILVASQQYSFFLAGPYAQAWMADNEILGTWSDLGIEGPYAKEPVAVPLSGIREFSGTYTQPLEDVCLCITPAPEDPDALEAYERQAAALYRLLDLNGQLPPAN